MFEVVGYLLNEYHEVFFATSLIIAICEVCLVVSALLWFVVSSNALAKSKRQVEKEVEEQAAHWKNWRERWT